MIAAWMLYGIFVAAVVGVAGFAIEYALRALRRPVRFVWVGALLIIVFIPAVQFALASKAAAGAVSILPSANGAVLAPSAGSPRSQRNLAPIAAQPPLRFPRAVSVPNTLRTLDSPLLGLWLAGSILWAAMLLVSAARLRRQRAGWRAATIDGMPVYVSHDVGPALFGIARYSIVVPAWVLSLDDNRRQLVLAHEREHARAADPVVLAAGALLVMLQPWNPGAWLMFRRLRFGIELDCDARVLARTPDVRSYGELLLEVGDRTLAGAVPLAALSEPHSLLERRISIMTAIPPSRPLLRGLVSLTAGALLAIGACTIPRPTPAGITAQTAVTPAIDFIQYRWVSATGDGAAQGYVDPASGQALTLGDSMVVDIAAIDSAWVTSHVRGPDATAGVTISLTPSGAGTLGAETATHLGQRLAVVVDDRVLTVATVGSRFRNTIPLVTDATPAAAYALAARVNRAVDQLRPYQPLSFQRPLESAPGSRPSARSDRVIVRITEVGLKTTVRESPTVLVFAADSARVGIGNDAPTILTDTMRLSSLPAMTLDVTDGDVHVLLVSPGQITIRGTVTGGPATHLSATGRHIVVRKGG
ncbi:MAG: M56 family metallopeptidase, partial [Gemmatimonadaceae bacterium]